jgi:hypothetical protein
LIKYQERDITFLRVDLAKSPDLPTLSSWNWYPKDGDIVCMVTDGLLIAKQSHGPVRAPVLISAPSFSRQMLYGGFVGYTHPWPDIMGLAECS